jgi:SET domain-containing protein
VRWSTIVGAGLGLFTTRPRHKREYLGYYRGDGINRAELLRRYGGNTATYVWETEDPDYFIDARDYDCCLERFANDGTVLRRNNVRVRIRGRGVSFYATRDIRAGEELLYSYGDKYWT